MPVVDVVVCAKPTKKKRGWLGSKGHGSERRQQQNPLFLHGIIRRWLENARAAGIKNSFAVVGSGSQKVVVVAKYTSFFYAFRPGALSVKWENGSTEKGKIGLNGAPETTVVAAV